MIKRKHKATPAVETPAVAPTVEAVVEQPKAKKVRYAPVSILQDTAVITFVKPNPKRGKSAVRYDQFYKTGLTVAQVIQAYKDANLQSLARPDLRWDVEHGNIQLEQPQS